MRSAHKTHSSQAWCCFMRRHTADVQARRQDGGAGRALRHLGDPVGKFFPLKILAGILYFPVPGVEKKKKLPVPRVTEISTVHLFISNLTRAVWGLTRYRECHNRHISPHRAARRYHPPSRPIAPLAAIRCMHAVRVRAHARARGHGVKILSESRKHGFLDP